MRPSPRARRLQAVSSRRTEWSLIALLTPFLPAACPFPVIADNPNRVRVHALSIRRSKFGGDLRICLIFREALLRVRMLGQFSKAAQDFESFTEEKCLRFAPGQGWQGLGELK